MKAILTIDGFPHKNSRAIVDYLSSRQIPAIFFAAGSRMEKDPDIVRYAISKGFVIGNHTWSHPHLAGLSFEECVEEIEKCEKLLDDLYAEEKIARPVKLFRFPYLEVRQDLNTYLIRSGFYRLDDTGFVDYRKSLPDSHMEAYVSISFDCEEWQLMFLEKNRTFSSILEHIDKVFGVQRDGTHVVLTHSCDITEAIEGGYFRRIAERMDKHHVTYVAPQFVQPTLPQEDRRSVGIVIPAFQCGDRIGLCLNSCISQSHGNIRIQVVKYESDDETSEIIQNYQALDHRIHVTERKRGVPYRTDCREQLQSDYLLFVDPSEELPHDSVEKLLEQCAEGQEDPKRHFYLRKNPDETGEEYSCLKPEVSCIIPIYQAERFLTEAVDSVRNQSLRPVEIVCVDDGSSDTSLRIMEETAFLDNRVVMIENGHQGVSAARNTGIQFAAGEYVAFLDSDDYLPDPHVYQRLLTAAREQQVEACGGSFSMLNHRTGKVTYPSAGREAGMTFAKTGMMSYQDYQYDFSFYRFIYRREFLLSHQLFFLKRSIYEDPVWFVRVLDKAGRFYALKEVTYCFRKEHKPPTSAAFTEENITSLLEGFADIITLAKKREYDRLYKLEMERLLLDYAQNIAVIVSKTTDPQLVSAMERFCSVSGMTMSQFLQKLLMRYAEVSDIRWKRRTAELEKRIKSLETSHTDMKKALEKEAQEKKNLIEELEKKYASIASADALGQLEQRIVKDEEQLAQLQESYRQSALSAAEKPNKKKSAVQKIEDGLRYIGSWTGARRTIVLQMRDRLGNQMFIYALYCRLKSMGRRVAIDDESWYLHTPAGKNALREAFRLDYETAAADTVRALEDSGGHRFDRLRRRVFGRRSLERFEQPFLYDPAFLQAKNGYFTGWFQDLRYFQPVAGEIRKAFAFDVDALCQSETAGLLYQEITGKKHTVSIHLRYGDYLIPENAAVYGGICTEAYYSAAVRYFQDLFPDEPVDYYVFSDDTDKAVEWIRDVFEQLHSATGSAHLIHRERIPVDVWQMALMSACHHHIIANSIFSWWAAFLNPNREKIIVRPSVWQYESGESIPSLSTDVPAVIISPDGKVL